jgi:hypothetical protein
MNDWSRLAVDPKTTQKLGADKNELHKYKYAPDKAAQGVPIRSRGGFTKAFVERSDRTTPSVLDKYLS